MIEREKQHVVFADKQTAAAKTPKKNLICIITS